MTEKTKQFSFWKNVPFKGFFYSSVALNIVVIILIIGLKNFLPPIAPLFYGRPEGSTQLIPTLWLILAPIVSLVITFLNLILTKFISDKFMQRVLVSATLLVSILTSITILKIIFLIGFF